jgi:hypothetical protein
MNWETWCCMRVREGGSMAGSLVSRPGQVPAAAFNAVQPPLEKPADSILATLVPPTPSTSVSFGSHA